MRFIILVFVFSVFASCEPPEREYVLVMQKRQGYDTKKIVARTDSAAADLAYIEFRSAKVIDSLFAARSNSKPMYGYRDYTLYSDSGVVITHPPNKLTVQRVENGIESMANRLNE